MSEIIDMRSFAADRVKPVSDPLQGKLDLALRLVLSVMMPPKIRNARIADARDIEIRQKHIKLALDAVGEYVNAVMSELNENLRLDNTIDTTDFFSALADMQSDLNWLLDRAAEHSHE